MYIYIHILLLFVIPPCILKQWPSPVRKIPPHSMEKWRLWIYIYIVVQSTPASHASTIFVQFICAPHIYVVPPPYTYPWLRHCLKGNARFKQIFLAVWSEFFVRYKKIGYLTKIFVRYETKFSCDMKRIFNAILRKFQVNIYVWFEVNILVFLSYYVTNFSCDKKAYFRMINQL